VTPKYYRGSWRGVQGLFESDSKCLSI